MQKSFVAAPLFSFSSISPGPDVLAVAAAVAEDSGSWVFCPGKALRTGPGLSPSFFACGDLPLPADVQVIGAGAWV